MASDARLDVMLSLPILHALPGVRVGRSRPSSAHAVPFDAGPHPGWRSDPRNGQAQQPPRSLLRWSTLVCGRVVVPSSPLALHGTARFGSAPLRATRLLLAPPVVSEERSVNHAQTW